MLTFLELADAGVPRAFLRVGGTTVARQQVALALDLGCERIVCIAPGMRPEIIELQHLAEARGAQFHVVAGARALLGLVTSSDELLVLGDGLFASAGLATDLLGQGQAVLVQPIEQGLAAGFERIDLTTASASAMRVPGRLVDGLGELPPDCDAASSLQRLALQSGVRQRSLPGVDGGQQFWSLVRSDAEAQSLEPQWIRQRTSDDRPLYPSRFLALAFVRGLGPSLLHAGSGATHLAIGAAMMAAIAVAAGWLGFFATGLIFCAVGWLCREIAALLARVETGLLQGRHQVLAQVGSYGWMVDAIIIGLVGWGSTTLPLQDLPYRFFPAFMLVALMRIIPGLSQARWTAWLGDRAALALGLAAALGAGVGTIAVHAGAVAAALAGILVPRLTKRLTRP
ncbi:hypothetical protein B0I00_0743 [Novosphingobium kunmingense]|uniref:Uncharacterized protein n=1 Tax=Novosphingobium kunmingense TaxID=1211806 RepID=A0A2N0I300_9SPHN|nr:hypothetical protein [Novosphingobium kunmingense]PKB25541.1 hypothetical protein B0I00_0743 [Novosphingobium kunmingense]